MLALRFFTPLRFVQNDMVGAASMDSRLHGNDGKHPPLLCRFFGLRSFAPLSSVFLGFAKGVYASPPFAERKGVRGMPTDPSPLDSRLRGNDVKVGWNDGLLGSICAMR